MNEDKMVLAFIIWAVAVCAGTCVFFAQSNHSYFKGYGNNFIGWRCVFSNLYFACGCE